MEVGAGLDCIYLMLIGLPCLGEGIHVLFLERFCRWRIHLQRVDRRSVLPYTEVKVLGCLLCLLSFKLKHIDREIEIEFPR